MSIKIAKIVRSNSHVDYVGRVIDVLDTDNPPCAGDYGFGQFVTIPIDSEMEIIGIVYNSELINPDYGNFGPRLSPAPDLSILSPDYLNEQGILLGILLLGWRERGINYHTIPRRIVPVGQDIYCLPDKEIRDFHRGRDGHLQVHYYSHLITHAKVFATSLLENIIEYLEPACTKEERQQLCVLKRSLVWQRTLGNSRF
jgi:hypothetical protein